MASGVRATVTTHYPSPGTQQPLSRGPKRNFGSRKPSLIHPSSVAVWRDASRVHLVGSADVSGPRPAAAARPLDGARR